MLLCPFSLSMLPLSVEAGHEDGIVLPNFSYGDDYRPPQPSTQQHRRRLGLGRPTLERYTTLASKIVLFLGCIVAALSVLMVVVSPIGLGKEVNCTRSHEMRGDRYAWTGLTSSDEDFVSRYSGSEFKYGIKQFGRVDPVTGSIEYRNVTGILSEIEATNESTQVLLLLHGNRGTYGNFDELAATLYRDWSAEDGLQRTMVLALDFYEEPNAFHPSVVEAQADFARGVMAGVCTRGISCAIVGHSMGGVVASIAISKSSKDIVANVVALVTVSAPLKTHPAMLDFGWQRVYDEVRRGLEMVPVVSMTGGAADWQVPMEDTKVDGLPRFRWALMPASEGVYSQGDHIAVMYSYEVLTYQVVPAIARAFKWDKEEAVIGSNEDLAQWVTSVDRPARRMAFDEKLDMPGDMVVQVKPVGMGSIRQMWNRYLVINAAEKGGAVLALRREARHGNCPEVKSLDFDTREFPMVPAPELCEHCFKPANQSAVISLSGRILRLTKVRIRGAMWCMSPPLGPEVGAVLVPPGPGFQVGLAHPGVMKLKASSPYKQYEMKVRTQNGGMHFACLSSDLSISGDENAILSAAESSITSGYSLVMAPSVLKGDGQRRRGSTGYDTLVVISASNRVGNITVDYSKARVPTLMRMLLTSWPYLLGSLQVLLALQVLFSATATPSRATSTISPVAVVSYFLLSTLFIPLLLSTSTLSLVLMSLYALVLHAGAYGCLGLISSRGPNQRKSRYSVEDGDIPLEQFSYSPAPSKRSFVHYLALSSSFVLYLVLFLLCPGIFGHLAALVIGFWSMRHSPCEGARLAVLVLLQSFAINSLQFLYTVTAFLSKFLADRPHSMVGVSPLAPGIPDGWALLDGAATAVMPMALALCLLGISSSKSAMGSVVTRASMIMARGCPSRLPMVLIITAIAVSSAVGSGYWDLPLYFMTIASQCLVMAYLLLLLVGAARPHSQELFEAVPAMSSNVAYDVGQEQQQSWRRRVLPYPEGNDREGGGDGWCEQGGGSARDEYDDWPPYMRVSVSPRSSASTASSTAESDMSSVGSSGSGEDEEATVKTRRRPPRQQHLSAGRSPATIVSMRGRRRGRNSLPRGKV